MINVAVIGFGTVGSGTVKVLLQNSELIKERTGLDIRLKWIADLDIEKDRGVKLPEGVLTTDAYKAIDDPEVNIVVELIGGKTKAKELILRALRNGKNVVTANKALLAEDGYELFKEAYIQSRELGFEAAVAGGIPIIKVLKEGLVANNIIAAYGIINGTSNYILSKMTKDKIDFNTALAEAQVLGYAEQDPTYDIEGIDTAHKLTLMATLVYGIPLYYNEVYKEGITGITPEDITYAHELGYKIKLLAITKMIDGEIELRVHPTMIPDNYLISRVEGVFNAIYIRGDAVGDTLYYGRGAGDLPTGSAVVSDIIDIAKVCSNGKSYAVRMDNKAYKIKKIEDILAMYYFRFSALDKPGVLSKISGILGEHDISISAVIQKERRKGEAVPVIVLTHLAREKNVLEAIATIDKLPVITTKTHFIRVENQSIG
ncbi:MAG: homoserine dehydrogenase [Candidatus Magnetoovum sp. WYHC-5]|nr:homoserine dehydrogenase [Candidatus Magnetoovum sp. WYHC-5]